MLASRRWRSSHLLLAWVAYWLLLIAVTLGRAIVAAYRATQAPDGHGSIDAGLTDGLAHLKVVQDGTTTWTGSATVGEIAFWLVVPPLLLWLVWLASRPRPDAAPAALQATDRPALGAPADDWPAAPRREAEHARKRE